MKYTIDDFKNGRVIIENNSKEVIREVLEKSFPNFGKFNGAFKYYWVGMDSKVWQVTDFLHNLPNLPIQKATDLSLGPQRGDYVMMRDSNSAWVRRIYITTVEGASSPYFAVNQGSEEEFKKGKPFFVAFWEEMKPIEEEQIIELTIQDISDGKGVGIPAHLIRIKK